MNDGKIYTSVGGLERLPIMDGYVGFKFEVRTCYNSMDDKAICEAEKFIEAFKESIGCGVNVEIKKVKE